MSSYEAITSLLNANSVNYQELDHDPVYTTEDAAKIPGLTLESGAKSMLLKTKNKFILIVMSGSKKLDSKKLKKALGVKEIRFATPAEVKDQMGCIVGACYPFGSIANLETYLDKSLLDQSSISINPGLHDKSLILKLSDFVLVEKPQIVDVSAL